MTTTNSMSDTQRALLDAILENPDDDDRRLVYSDWLEENEAVSSVQCPKCQGNHGSHFVDVEVTNKGLVAKTNSSWIDCGVCGARGFVSRSNGFARYAEFIRKQVGIANPFVCLYSKPDTCFQRRDGVEDVGQTGCYVCRERAALLIKEAALWGSWPDTNDVRSLIHDSMPNLEGGWVVLPSSFLMHGSRWAKVNRGFVEQIAAPFDTHMAHLRDIVKRHPLKAHAQMVTDKEPRVWPAGRWAWTCPEGINADARSQLPQSIIDMMPMASYDYMNHKCYRRFATRDTAMIALANALLVWAKS
jgi:uncharacterized protein (TIGR02996 family)